MKSKLLKLVFITFSLLFSQTVIRADVTKTVGTAGDYTTLKAAFDAINAAAAPSFSGASGVITLQITSDLTEIATASLSASGTSACTYTSVHIYPTGAYTITGALASPLITLNGADSVTIDGRINRIGETPSLSITNTDITAGARTVEFISSAEDNFIQYCTVKGAGATSTQGIINFSTSTTVNGNSGNTIAYCKISGLNGTDRPYNAINSVGSVGFPNIENTIRSNSIFDFFRVGNSSNGIYVGANSSRFSIVDNSFYESASFAPTADTEYAVVKIDNTTGEFFLVSGNYIGGSAALCAGTAWTKTDGGSYRNKFYGIYLSGSESTSSIQGNVIRNFNYTNTGGVADVLGDPSNSSSFDDSNNWYAIYVANGSAIVGTVTGNTIGAATGNGSITYTCNTNDWPSVFGIGIYSNYKVECKNNTIGSFTLDNATSTLSVDFRGIYKNAAAGDIYAVNNIIGSTTTANSIQLLSPSSDWEQKCYGIYANMPNSTATGRHIISGNTVANLSNNTQASTTLSKTAGIFIKAVSTSASSDSIVNNTVYNIKTSSHANSSLYKDASLMGIGLVNWSGTANNIVRGNTVYNLEYTGASAINMYGIFMSCIATASNANQITQNFVHTFKLSNGAPSASSKLSGICVNNANATLANNVISLGSNITVGCTISGILFNDDDAALQSIKAYHNTVYLSGNAASGDASTAAFRSVHTAAGSAIDVRNNILWNARAGTAGGTDHFVLSIGTATDATVDYNACNFTNSFGEVNSVVKALYTDWTATVASDTHSVTTNPTFYNAAGTLSSDFQTGVALNGVNLTATIAGDYNDVTRSTTPTMGAWEFFASPVEVLSNNVSVASFTTLKLAFDAINANTGGLYVGDLIVKLKGNTTETASAVLNERSPSRRTRIYPARTGVVISGDLAEPLIDLNGVDSVVINGAMGGTGTTKDMIITNTSTSSTAGTSTIRFINDASNNTIKNCTIKGSSIDPLSGVIFFSTASTIGNRNDSIFNNNITNNGGNRPINGVFSLGTSDLTYNQDICVVNNYFYDLFNTSVDVAMCHLSFSSYTHSCDVVGNSFYETTAFNSPYDKAMVFVNIVTGTNDFLVQDNYFGGTAPRCGGSKMTKNFTDTKSAGFSAIKLGLGSTGTRTKVYSNTINNIDWKNRSSTENINMIFLSGGSADIGAAGFGNLIGSITGNDSIVYQARGEKTLYGISIQNAGTVNCEYNRMGGFRSEAILADGSSNTTLPMNAIGIRIFTLMGTTGTVNVRYNQIGSATVSNSIRAVSVAQTATITSPQLVCGVVNEATEGTITISDNVICNLTNGTTCTTVTVPGVVRGISSTTGATSVTVSNNTIRDLTIASASTATDFSASAIGIALGGVTASRTVTGNTIYNISNTYSAFAGQVMGVYYEGPTTGTNTVSRNFIHSLSTPTGTSTASLFGIKVVSGVTTYFNNIINLGTGTQQNTIYGIYDTGAASQTCNVYFNTVYIAGTPSSGALVSSAMYSNANTNTRDYRNNIFFNARSNSGATGKHYAIYHVADNTGLTSNYNNYYVTGTDGVLGYYPAADKTTLADIQAVTGDANSLNTNPTFAGTEWTTATNYTAGVDLTGTNVSISNDYGYYSRGTTPTMGAWERNVNKWMGFTDTTWATTTNWSGGVAPSSEDNINFDAAAVNNCELNGSLTVTNISNSSTKSLVIGANTLTVKGSLSFPNTANGGQIDASATGSGLVFSGTSAQSIAEGTFVNNEVYNLTVNNPNNVLLGGTLRLLNTITASSGRLDATTNAPTVVYAGTSAQTIEPNLFLNERIQDLVIDNASVTLNTDLSAVNSVLINAGKKLIIPTEKQLNVLGTISNLAGVNGLLIKAGADVANGTLIFHNPTIMEVEASVEMYSKADYQAGRDPGYKYAWQFFGIPMRSMIANNVFYGSYLRAHNEAGTTEAEKWVSLNTYSVLTSFKGYEVTQVAHKTFTYQGFLENKSVVIPLPYTSAPYIGQHIVANSYTAAINISQLTFGSQTEATVYIYNTGNWTDWHTNSGSTSPDLNPGQYNAAPKYVAGFGGIPGEISSMQGFLVKALSSSANATLSIPYSSVVVKNTLPQRAPSSGSRVFTKIELSSANYNDQMWLFTDPSCTRGFDNGWDGAKVKSSTSKSELYAREADGDYQVNSVNDVENTALAFQAGTDSVFTITFTHENTSTEYPSLYLVDLQDNTAVDITASGSQYTFTATPNAVADTRFKIVRSADMTTNTDGIDAGKVDLHIFTTDGKIFIDNKTAHTGEFTIYDLTGKGLIKDVITPNAMNTYENQLKTGAYIVKARLGVNELSKRIVIR